MIRYRGPLILIAVALLALTGCTENPAQSDQAGMSAFTVTTVSGREIECVSWSSYQKGGLSCDWSPR